MDNHDDNTFLLDANASPALCEFLEPPALEHPRAAAAPQEVPGSPFADQMHGCYMAEALMSIRLLKLLQAIRAPHHVYRSIMDIFANGQQAKA